MTGLRGERLARCLTALGLVAFMAPGCGRSHGAALAPAPMAAQHVRLTALSHAIGVRVPIGWHAIDPPVTSLGEPSDRMLVTSFRAARGGGCSPGRAEAQLPAGGALIYLMEYRSRSGSVWSGLRRSSFPSQPRHFRLAARDLALYECWRVPSYLLRFRAAGRAFQAHVAFGAKAGRLRRRQALSILDSLRIGPTPRAAAVTAARLAAALRANPGNAAAAVRCRAASASDRRRSPFGRGGHRFACTMALRGMAPALFDVQVFHGCFVAERRRRGAADYGCLPGPGDRPSAEG